MQNKKRILHVFYGAGFLLVALIPLLIQDEYILHLSIMACIYIVLAMSLNLLLGFSGLFSLGHAAFYGIGAYTSALLTLKAGLPFELAFVLSGLITAFIGFLFGFPALRLRGIFLAVGTLGFNQIVYLLLVNWEGLTGGPAGLAGIPGAKLGGFIFSQSSHYYVAAITLAVVLLTLTWRILISRPGRALIAIRDDEMAARAVGIDVTRYKLIVFSFSTFLAGLAGSFFAHYLSYVSPDNFTINESFVMVSIVALGGMGNFFGSILGAIILVVLPEYFRFLQDYRSFIYGAALVFIMFFLPKGILGWYRPGMFQKIWKKTEKGETVHGISRN